MFAFPGYPGLPEQPYDVKQVARFISHMQEQQFDLVIQMQGDGTKVNQLMELFGARYCAGFYTPSDYKPAGDLFMPYPGEGHETGRHLGLMHFLGIPGGSPDLEFPVTDEDRMAFEKLNLGLKEKEYACIHPGSRGSYRQWPPKFFARMADICAGYHLTPVLTGTAGEMDIVLNVASMMKHKPVIAAGKTHLGTMAVLLSRACALVSNCTGVSHMAAALKTPGIIISMDGEPERWGPLDHRLFYTLNWLEIPEFERSASALETLLRAGSFKTDQQYA
jgi:ADP-heptose:LPS heptosyltransferase